VIGGLDNAPYPLREHVVMKALVLEEFNQPYRLRTNVAIPIVEEGMMLVKVKAAGFCHTDLLVRKVPSLYSISIYPLTTENRALMPVPFQ
jgi:D-arabinose 1-dehydrogenase-like Zn-dependent alcohol dehydrogenase